MLSYKLITCYILVLFTHFSQAALKPMTDDQMSNSTGQAFLQLDRSAANGLDFTKVTLGLDVETSLNADLVELGNYERNGSAGADVRIRDLALGEVNADGSITPFKIKDPFIELAFDKSGGSQKVVGVRIGFGEALGKLSGDIKSLTGNIEVNVVGTARPIFNRANFFQRAALTLAGVSRDTRLRADAVLVDSSGNPTNIRAQQVGVPNGSTLQCESGCNLGGLSDFLLGLFGSNNCGVLGLPTCFSLGDFRSLDIGSGNTPARGMFLSFQSQPVTWRDGNSNTQTVSGAFVNIPNGGITVDFEQSFGGIPRVRTKMLDPYYDN